MTKTTPTNETMLAVNEALILGSLRQHELTEAAELLNVRLQQEIAERKQIEVALHESEVRYHRLFNSIDEGFCVIERVEAGAGEAPDFLYLEANPAFTTQSGMSKMVGKTIRQALPDEPDGWCSIYDTVLRTGEPKRFERGLVTHGRVLELYAFRAEDETHRRVAVIFKDITERKRAEAALRESEERFRTLFELGPVAVYSCDASGVIKNFNRRAAELWGRAPALGDTDEQFCGSFKLFRPDGSFMPHEQCPMAEVVADKIPAVHDAEVLIERPDGSRVSVVVNIRPLKNEQGEVTGAINCFYDITERKQAEESRRNILARFQVLADNMPALCWMANADGWIFWYNRRWYDYTGTTPETQEGWGWQSVHDPEILPAVMERWKASIATGQPFEMVFPLKGADGVFRPFLTRIVPLRDKDGLIVQWFGNNTDITNERKAEERQQFLTKELAHRGNNLLAVIQSIASRTLSGKRTLAEAREVFRNRIQALARSQSVLLGEGFEGAPVTEIIRLEFEGFSERIKAVGPQIMLNPRAAQTFALLVHELATNATKHGALSLPEGQVAIHWSFAGTGTEARFKFQWQESDGPPVAPPTRQGFGHTVLENAVAKEFGAPPTIRFAPEGLSYEIDVPLSAVAA